MTTTSRCLARFVKGFDPSNVADIKARIESLPKSCPHDDCSRGTCEDHCRPYAEMQYRIAKKRSQSA